MATLTDLATKIGQDIKAVRQDTGVRNIATTWDPGSTGGTATLRRIGKTVYLDVYGVTMTGNAAVLTLPSGFRPSSNKLLPNVAYPSTTARAIITASSGAMQVLGYTAGAQYLALSWLTDDPWPTTLPGTAA